MTILLSKNQQEMNKTAQNSVEQNTIINLSGTQTDGGDENNEKIITSVYILDTLLIAVVTKKPTIYDYQDEGFTFENINNEPDKLKLDSF